ncbi:hypothetical protein JTB14_015291 [Gonioctena quinquepunctata]|nr:hypothetical protein JTB14_015291 [Gonioctena quinquepunctata]
MTDINTHDEINLFNESSDASEKKFAEVIGYVEDILVDENFNVILEQFFKNFSEEKDHDVDLDLYDNYVATVKKHIEEQLEEKVKSFKMPDFEEELGKRESEIGTDIVAILSSFRSFQAFKQFVENYRETREKITDISKTVVSVSKLCL